MFRQASWRGSNKAAQKIQSQDTAKIQLLKYNAIATQVPGCWEEMYKIRVKQPF